MTLKFCASVIRRVESLVRTTRLKNITHSFCTYFDSRYLDKGLCLYESLRKQLGNVELWVLCLDAEVHRVMQRLELPGVHPLAMDELERDDPALKACRDNRRLVEYYFTSTPCLVRRLLQRALHPGWITYLDSDLYFFGSPAPIFEEMNAGDVAIIPHRFSESQRNLEMYGKYNVGWVSFRNSSAGLRCVEWWRLRCLEWCRDVPEDGKFADQKYLDHFHEVTKRVVAIRHPGANLAPWNLANHAITSDRDRVRVDGEDLIFFHFHDCKAAGDRAFDPGLAKYQVALPGIVRNEIYMPYLRLLLEKRRIGGTSTMRFDGTDIELPKASQENLIEVPLD